MHTKLIAGQEFLCLGQESYNLSFLVSARLWMRDAEGKPPVIILSFTSDTVYLSQIGDDGHMSNGLYYEHHELAGQDCVQALSMFGLTNLREAIQWQDIPA